MRLTLIGKRTNDKWTSGKMGNGKWGEIVGNWEESWEESEMEVVRAFGH